MGVAKRPGLNGRAVARLVRPFWPVRKNAGQCSQTRPVGEMAGLASKKEHALSQHSCDAQFHMGFAENFILYFL